MKAKLPVGVIGLGRMGSIYTGHLAGHSGSQILSVSDVIEERAQGIAAEFGVESWSTDYRDVLENKAIRAVFVTSPTGTYREVVRAAAEAGKAIFCEKPIALTLEDTDQMIATIEKTGVMFRLGSCGALTVATWQPRSKSMLASLAKRSPSSPSAVTHSAQTWNLPNSASVVA